MTKIRVISRGVIKMIMRIWERKKSLLSASSVEKSLTPKIGNLLTLPAVSKLCAISVYQITMLLGYLTLSALTADSIWRVSQPILSLTMKISSKC